MYLVIESFRARSFLCHLIAIRISFTEEILAAKRRSVNCVCFIMTTVCFLDNVINLVLNDCTLVLAE